MHRHPVATSQRHEIHETGAMSGMLYALPISLALWALLALMVRAVY